MLEEGLAYFAQVMHLFNCNTSRALDQTLGFTQQFLELLGMGA